MFDWLREHDDVSAGELAMQAMDDKGFDPAASDTRRDFVHRFTMAFHDMLRSGTLARIGRGQGVRWKLAADLL